MREALGSVDILVNNTGGPAAQHGPAGVDVSVWTSHFQSMVVGVIHVTDLVLPVMRDAGWGRIITSTSSGVVAPIPNCRASNALRMALVGWSKTLSREVGSDGITANVVLPGRIATQRIQQLDVARAEREGISVEEVQRVARRRFPWHGTAARRWIRRGVPGKRGRVLCHRLRTARRRRPYPRGLATAASRRSNMTDTTTDSAEQVRERFLAVDTSNVADVLDTLDLPDQGLAADFAPFPADAGKLAGWAFTIRGQMAPYERGGGDAEKMQACAHLTPGSVSVWSGGGEGVCYFGELIAIGMRERGCVGALVDGGIRDVAWLGRQNFSVYARYRTPVQSIGRWKVTGWDVPVSVPGATRAVEVHPGDFVLADDDGAIVIAAVVPEVLERAEAMGLRVQEYRRAGQGPVPRGRAQEVGHVEYPCADAKSSRRWRSDRRRAGRDAAGGHSFREPRQGLWLREQRLDLFYGVSRTLGARGAAGASGERLVEVVPNRGALGAAPSSGYREAYAGRAELEGSARKLAAEPARDDETSADEAEELFRRSGRRGLDCKGEGERVSSSELLRAGARPTTSSMRPSWKRPELAARRCDRRAASSFRGT